MWNLPCLQSNQSNLCSCMGQPGFSSPHHFARFRNAVAVLILPFFFFPSQVFINFSEAINRWLNLRTFKKNMCGGITWVYWFHTPQQSGKLHLHPAPWVHLMVKKLYIFHSYSPFPYVTRFLPPLIENTKLLMWTSDTTSSFRSKKNCQLMKLKT